MSTYESLHKEMSKLKEDIERDTKRLSYISSLLCKHDREVLRFKNINND